MRSGPSLLPIAPVLLTVPFRRAKEEAYSVSEQPVDGYQVIVHFKHGRTEGFWALEFDINPSEAADPSLPHKLS